MRAAPQNAPRQEARACNFAKEDPVVSPCSKRRKRFLRMCGPGRLHGQLKTLTRDWHGSFRLHGARRGLQNTARQA